MNDSYIIFICLSDLFGKGRYRYSFENICKEDTEVMLNDGAKKIFLNADGKKGDISEELKAFLDYVAGRPSEDAFVKKLESAVEKAKKNRKWRREYMTLLMRDRENQKIGKEIGKIFGAISVQRPTPFRGRNYNETTGEVRLNRRTGKNIFKRSRMIFTYDS